MVLRMKKKIQIASLLLIFVFSQTALTEDEINDCSQEIYDDAPQCPSSKTYLVRSNGVTCKVALTSTSTNCYNEESELGKSDEIAGLDSQKLIGGRSISGSKSSCKWEQGPIVIQQIPNPTPNCFTYKVPVCEDGKYELGIQILGGSDATYRSKCYDIKINDEGLPRVASFDHLNSKTCPRIEVLLKLLVNQNQTELQNAKQKMHLLNNEFSLNLCFTQCGNETRTLQLGAVLMKKIVKSGSAKPCKGVDSNFDSNCKYYSGSISSECWSHGCQYYLDGEERCAKGALSCEARSYEKCICSHKFCDHLDPDYCTFEPSIFQSHQMTCRRANTYYVYHPKQHCYSATDSGDCTATAIHAVNINGPALTDQRGIRYIAGRDARMRDPTRMAYPLDNKCKSVFGLNHEDTRKIYNSMIGGRERKERGLEYENCFWFPIPICQSGEYMLTVKLMDFAYDRPQRCTEVRINDVQIMLHLDTYVLAGEKQCGPVDAVVMFLAEGGDDNNPKSDRTLYLKGHVEPIRVRGGMMKIQFCYGYDCDDNNPLVSAFSLERLTDDTKPCKF